LTSKLHHQEKKIRSKMPAGRTRKPKHVQKRKHPANKGEPGAKANVSLDGPENEKANSQQTKERISTKKTKRKRRRARSVGANGRSRGRRG